MSTVFLDPEFVEPLAAFPRSPLSAEVLPSRRSQLFAPPFIPTSEVTQSDHVVNAATGVTLRVYRPASLTAEAGCIYTIHGGGYVLGDYTMEDARFDHWCRTLGCVGVSVEYRLAPEFPYPTPLEDCYAGLAWVVAHAVELGVSRDLIGISGISAGGGLAAALALLARDRGEIALAFTLLECPMIDDRQITPSSQLDDLAVWSKESNTFGWRSYLGALHGADDVPYHAAPARATDLSGLPPTMVITGGADGFRDENIDYALRLGQAGVPTALHVLPGVPHGVSLAPRSQACRTWDAIVDGWLARQLAR